MRDDMARVIVERPRTGGDRGRKGRAVSLKDLPKSQGMKRRHVLSGDWKMLNENLAPLRRYLERQVGRPWNKVFPEIARHLRVDNTVQQHVRDHLKDFVAITPRHCNTWCRQHPIASPCLQGGNCNASAGSVRNHSGPVAGP